MAKNTAPAIAAACHAAMEQDKDSIVVVLPSDHVIKDNQAFQKAVITAAKNAENNKLVTFGIVPTFAATGYGYVKASGSETNGAYILEKFVEKPCLEKAQEYIASGEYSWNSGMFVFKASAFLEELKNHNSEMAQLSKDAFEKAEIDKDFIRLDKEAFSKIKGDSIDYAVMEKTKLGMIVKLNAGWDDVGSWSALYDISTKDKNNNAIKGDVITLGTENSYIHAGKRTIATIGLNNIVIVDSDDSLLIARMDKIQDVKKIAEEMKKGNKFIQIKRLYTVDIFRIISALMIFLFHARSHLNTNFGLLNNFIGNGHIFMIAFFMLSGFSLYYVDYEKKNFNDKYDINPILFIKKRLISIYPLYITVYISYTILHISKLLV